jgi:hypothetical protein
MNRCTEINEVWYSTIKEHGSTYKIYLNLFLTKLSNMTIVRNFEVMLGQTLNYSMWNL